MMRGLIASVIGVVTGQRKSVALQQVFSAQLVERQSRRCIPSD